MNAADITFLVLVAAGGLYGSLRGLRPALFLSVALLAAVLVMLTATAAFESLMISLVVEEPAAYDGAPAVAVFILEGRTTAAYLAALFPVMVLVFMVFALVLGGALFKRFITDASRTGLSRIAGALCGIVSGGILSLLLMAQMMRLPWPAAGNLLGESLFYNALNHAAGFLLPPLAGGR